MSFLSKSTPARNRGVPQLDLFPSSTPTIVGTVISLERACPHCGATTTTVGSSAGPHWARLTCTGCNRHRGWLAGSQYRFLSSGAPNFTTGLSSHPPGTAP